MNISLHLKNFNQIELAVLLIASGIQYSIQKGYNMFSAATAIQNLVTCQELVSCSKHSVLWKLKVYHHSSLASSL
jgi:hypothetical protein